MARKDGEPPDRAKIEKQIRDLAGATKQNKYQLGGLWLSVMKFELWKTTDSHTPQQYLTKTFVGLDLSVKEMSTWASIARDFKPEDADRAGIKKLTLLQRYAHLMSIDQLEGPGKLPILVRGDGGKFVSRPFEDCTETDLIGAIQHAEGTDVVVPMPEEAQQKLRAVRLELDGLTHSPIHTTGKMVEGHLVLGFEGVADEELAVFAHGVAGVASSADMPRRPSKKPKTQPGMTKAGRKK